MQKGKHEPLIPLQFDNNKRGSCFYTFQTYFKGVRILKCSDDREQREFVELVAMLKYYKHKGVPIPADVRNEIKRNRNKSDVFYVLSELIND